MFVPINDTLVNAVSFGSGHNTLVAHGGWTGSWEIWQQPFERLSRTRRCISYDHRGSGETAAPGEKITGDQLVADLFSLLDAFEIDRCTLAAESMGGVIAMLAVEQQPQRFQGLVLVSSASEVTREATVHLVEGSRADYRATVTAFVEAAAPEPDTDHLKRWGRDILMRADPENAARLFEGSYGVSANLAAIVIPTLVIHGTADAIVPTDTARRIASEIKNAELHIIEGAGHVPTVTRPDVVTDIIEHWLERLED